VTRLDRKRGATIANRRSMNKTLGKTLCAAAFVAYAAAFGSGCWVHDRGPDRTVYVDHSHDHDHDHDRDHDDHH